MEIFIARQPIFDKKKEVIGYELLFRSSAENRYISSDPDHATMRVMSDSLHVFGLEGLTGGKKAFINLTREVLLSEFVSLLPSHQVVVEILENIQPDPEVLAACDRLKKAGYQLALDDFVLGPGLDPFLAFADIVKIDVLVTPLDQAEALLADLGKGPMKFLAEKVETLDMFNRCLQIGFVLFQGYFFSKPQMLSKRAIDGNKIPYLQILQEIHKSDLSFDSIERILKHDLSLSYKLLRYINSAFFGWNVEIRSIRHALVLMGQKDFRKWASLVVLISMATDKPIELILSTLIRAQLCESLADRLHMPENAQDLFLLGLFSRLDAILNKPLAEGLKDIPLSKDISAALTGEDNRYRQVLNLIEAYERAETEPVKQIAQALGFADAEEELPKLYWQAVHWADQSTASLSK